MKKKKSLTKCSSDIFFIVPCGGSGTRLWPLSRKNRPKQLLSFLNDQSLLEQTIDRISTLAHDKSNIGIVTSQEQAHLTKRAVGKKIGISFIEPSARNTGPAMLYSCLELAKQQKSEEWMNSIVVFLPSDHFIPETKKYCSYLQKAIDHAASHDKIVTLGLMPTHPSTGYGYIQAQLSQKIHSSPFLHAGKAYDVKKFHEKPSAKKAEEYVNHGDMFWNLGMFIGKISTFLNEYKTHAPHMYKAIASGNYEKAEAISIDYAIMEKSSNVTVIPCDFEWHDVGNLDIFLSLQQKHSNMKQNLFAIDSKNNIAKTNKKIVSFIGIDDLCVIEDDDVLVVAKRDSVEKIKQIRAKLQKAKLENLL